MKLTAMHGFCIGNGVDVAHGQVFVPPSDSLGHYWVRTGAAFITPDETAATTQGSSDELVPPVPTKPKFPPTVETIGG